MVQSATWSGIPLRPYYSPRDMRSIGFDYTRHLGDPGTFPFTRSIKEGLYRDDFWVMGQYSGYASAEEANRRFRYLAEQGQTGFSIALDLPTQMGLDSDHPLAAGEVGKVGVAIDSLADMETLLEGVPLERIRQIRTTANAIAPIILSMFAALFERRGYHPGSIRVLLQNDILKEYICRGTYIFPPGPSVKVAVDVIEYCAQHLPRWEPMSVCGYHIRDAGATAVQELAFTLASAIAYFEEAMRRRLSVDDFAHSIYMFLASQIDLLEEVAKFRAARRLWATLMRERFGSKKPDAQALRIFAYTAGSALTAEQPLNNIVRVTIEALAAVLGGVQTLATSSYDEALCLPSDEAVTVALRTQQIIAHESGVASVDDPLGGSYVVEHLTCEIESEVRRYLDRIDSLGGSVKCIESGFFQQEIATSAYRLQREIEAAQRIVVGLNAFREEAERPIRIFRVDPAVERYQVEKLRKLRQSRSAGDVKSALAEVEGTARAGENLVPAVMTAVKSYATVGEICQVLRGVYGTYRPARAL